jgi:DNA-directed RNA polymerase subunit RPC12/RpoP
VVTVSGLDTETRIEASRSYVRLRRRYWRRLLRMPALLVVFVVVMALFAVFKYDRNPYARGTLNSLLVVAWFACWLRGVVTWYKLIGFRCPRCGKRFMMSWWSSWPGNRCKHCDLGPSAMAAATPGSLT